MESRSEKCLLGETTPPPHLDCEQLFGWNPSSQQELTSHPFLKRPSLSEFHQSKSQQHVIVSNLAAPYLNLCFYVGRRANR